MNRIQKFHTERLLAAWASFVRSDVNQNAPKCKSPGWHKMIGVAPVYIPFDEEREEETKRIMDNLKQDDYALYQLACQFYIEGKRPFEIAKSFGLSAESGAVSKKLSKIRRYVRQRHSHGERLDMAV